MFEVKSWHKFTEEDTWDEGCILNTAHMTEGWHTFKEEQTVENIIDKLMGFVGVTNREDVLLNSCDEPGRIDIQITENLLGQKASENEIKEWKKGKMRLWAACYTFYIEEVTRKTITLVDRRLAND